MGRFAPNDRILPPCSGLSRRAVAGIVFRYAIATGRATRNISVDLRGALTTLKVNHRAAITGPGELGALLGATASIWGVVDPQRRSPTLAPETALSRLKQGFDSARERQRNQQLTGIWRWCRQDVRQIYGISASKGDPQSA